MVARVATCALAGLEGLPVQVEVDIHDGLPHTTIVGLPDAAVREAKDRLGAAIRNAGYRYPQAKVTVNLAPADVRKEGPAYDLPMALAILLCSRQIDLDLTDAMVVGECSLDGELRHTNGILPIAAATRALGLRRIVLPEANAAEAALLPGLRVVAARTIPDLVDRLVSGRASPTIARSPWEAEPRPAGALDLTDVRGQGHARRALEIAAAGGHNLLLTGPPGAGKTLLAHCLPSILPELSPEEALEVTAVYSVAGALPRDRPLIRTRPFRHPHHTISCAGLIGGGAWPRPGEVSLAHHGVLFLDELPQFAARALEALRQPIEDRVVTIARAAGTVTYPASFTLVAARNPCPCGHLDDAEPPCTCTAAEVARYARRVSGPLLDRIDMRVEVPKVERAELLDASPGESSEAVRVRVAEARLRQRRRLALAPGTPPSIAAPTSRSWLRGPPTCNAEMGAASIRRHCTLTSEAEALLRTGMVAHQLSARSVHRVVKVARTIADVEGRARVQPDDIAEALHYQSRGRASEQRR